MGGMFCHAMCSMWWLTALLAATSLIHSEATECKGGKKAACHCLLGCNVYGHDPGKCDGVQDVNTVVSNAVSAALDNKTQCDGIECVVHCAKKLECLDEKVWGKCMNVKETMPSCGVD